CSIVKDIRSNNERKQGQEVWSMDYLSFSSEEYTPISDLFDYYYENEVQANEEYRIGSLDKTQQCKLELLLNEYKDICARSLSKLGKTQENIKKAQNKQKAHHDNKYQIETYQIGDKVMLHVTSLETSYSSKLALSFTGPYYIHEIEAPTTMGFDSYKYLEESAPEGAWTRRLNCICDNIFLDKNDQVGLLHQYYYLGECLTEPAWESVAFDWKALGITWSIAQGSYNLLGNKYITANTLYWMNKEDFKTLLEEAEKVRAEELSEFFNETFTEAQN
ncbi:12109_t:CDS:2, partial [Gigaspora margarita]